MKKGVREELKRIAGDGVRFDEPMANHTSLGVGGPALAVVYPDSPERLGATLAFLKREGIPCLPVGNGTNLIVRDGGYRGVIFCLKRLADIRIVSGPGNVTLLQAEAGASRAAAGAIQTGQEIEEGRFPRSAFTDERHNFAPGDLHAGPPEGGVVIVDLP